MSAYGPTIAALARAERRLRQYDKALRLRRSSEAADILLERKVRRGRIGAVLPGGLPYNPDAGLARELGHTLVGTLTDAKFDLGNLLDSLKAADTWRRTTPLWMYEEEKDARRDAAAKLRRSDGIRYKAEEVWNRYAWRSKSRVSVPVQLH